MRGWSYFHPEKSWRRFSVTLRAESRWRFPDVSHRKFERSCSAAERAKTTLLLLSGQERGKNNINARWAGDERQWHASFRMTVSCLQFETGALYRQKPFCVNVFLTCRAQLRLEARTNARARVMRCAGNDFAPNLLRFVSAFCIKGRKLAAMKRL